MNNIIDKILNLDSATYWMFIVAIFSFNLYQYDKYRELETHNEILLNQKDSLNALNFSVSLQLKQEKKNLEIISGQVLSSDDSIVVFKKAISDKKIALKNSGLNQRSIKLEVAKLDSATDVADSLMTLHLLAKEKLAKEYELKLHQWDSLNIRK